MHRGHKPARKQTPRGTDTEQRTRMPRGQGCRDNGHPSAKTQACTGAEAPWVLTRRGGDVRPQKPGLQGPQGSLGSSTSPAPLANLDPNGTLVTGGCPAVQPAGGWGLCGRCNWTTDAVTSGAALGPGELRATWPIGVSQAAYLGRWPAGRIHGG